MGHQHLRLFAVAPAKVVRPGTIDHHITFFARHLEGRHEPFRKLGAVAGPNRVNVRRNVFYHGHLLHRVAQSLFAGVLAVKPR